MTMPLVHISLVVIVEVLAVILIQNCSVPEKCCKIDGNKNATITSVSSRLCA